MRIRFNLRANSSQRRIFFALRSLGVFRCNDNFGVVHETMSPLSGTATAADPIERYHAVYSRSRIRLGLSMADAIWVQPP